MERYILSHDIGTSGNKATLFRVDGTLEDSRTVNYDTIYAHRGWAEQDPRIWWKAVCQATRELMEGRDGNCVKAIAVSGQMMGCLPLDRDGNPLANSIIWSDSRAEKESDELEQKLGKEYMNRLTGQPLSPNYPLPKMMWLKKHHPEIMEKADCFLQAKDYINYCLTGAKYTDPTDAAYTLAYDIGARVWSEEILSVAGIPISVFPPVVDCETIVGHVTEEAAKACGLVPGIPVVASAGDGSAAHLGGISVAHGDTYISLGTSTWIMTTTDHLVFDDGCRMQSEPHVLKGVYAYLGTMQTGGMSHAWTKSKMLGSRFSYEEIDDLVLSTEPGADGVIFMPYLMGERSPWYDTQVNAAFLGLRQQTGTAHMLRAVMEGVGFNLNILLNIIRKDVDVKQVVLIGGGVRGKVWKQILADIFGVPVLIPENVEAGTSLGAAMIAGVGCGLFEDYSVVKQFLTIREVVEPRPEYAKRYQRQAQIFEEAYHALRQVNASIGKLYGDKEE